MRAWAGLFAAALACAAGPALADWEAHWRMGGPPTLYRDAPREIWREHRPWPSWYQHVDHRRHRDAAVLGALGVGVILGSLIVPPPPRTVIVQTPPPVAPLVITPPPVFTPPVPPERLWYYCESLGQYYPQVRYCPEGWRTYPAP